MSIEKLRPSFTFTEDRLRELKAVVPEAFADGKINREARRLGLYVCLNPVVQKKTVDAIRLRAEDVLVCLDSALSDEAKITLADRCNLKVI